MMSGSCSEIANPVTHSAMEFFRKPDILINYESGYDQEVFPQTGCSGPTIDFLVKPENRTCLDLNDIYLNLKVAILDQDGNAPASESTGQISFINNVLHSLFSHTEVQLNGKVVSHANTFYHHKAYIETEFSLTDECKSTKSACQGYFYDGDPGNKSSEAKTLFRETLVANGYVLNLFGPPAIDFFNSEQFLIPGVQMLLRFYRASNDFSLLHTPQKTTATATDKTMSFHAQIQQASLFVRKVVMTESVKMSMERALLKEPARYPFIETLSKSAVIQANQNCYVHEGVFGDEPIRRLSVCMVKNKDFRGEITSNPYHYQKFGLARIEVTRADGIPIGGTPLDVDQKDTRAFYNTMTSLGFTNNCGNALKLSNYRNFYLLVFDLTSTREASKSLVLYPELTGASLTVKMFFEKALAEPIEVFFQGERFSQVYIDAKRNIGKNSMLLNG